MENNNKLTLDSLPVGTTIRFVRNGKEQYLRKIRTNARYWSPWYDPVKGESVNPNTVPREWQVL